MTYLLLRLRACAEELCQVLVARRNRKNIVTLIDLLVGYQALKAKYLSSKIFTLLKEFTIQARLGRKNIL